MIKEKYLKKIRTIIEEFVGPNAEVLIFGSSLESDHFNDIDIGVVDPKMELSVLGQIKEAFEESDIPYKIDVVDFNKVDEDFKKVVFNNKIKWLISKKN